MTSWCYNKIVVIGKKDKIQQVFDFLKTGQSEFDFEIILPTPKDADPYKWRLSNWGTGYNSFEPMTMMPYIWFKTAYGNSLEVTEKLSALFPDVTFSHKWRLEMDGDGGLMERFKGGKYTLCKEIKKKNLDF